MQTILSPEDSKRVANALIKKIEEIEFNIDDSIRDAIRSVLMPRTQRSWREDWFPLTIEQMCDEISHGVIGAVYEAANKKYK